MKKSVIIDVLNGVKGNRESTRIKTSKEYENNLTIICDTYEELKKQLPPQLFQLHQKFVDALENNFCEEIDLYFVEAFKLGLLIGIESMDDE